MNPEPKPTIEPTGEDVSAMARPGTARPTLSPLRSALPFFVAAFLLWLLARRLDFDAFFATLARVNLFALLGFAMLWQTVLLAADATGLTQDSKAQAEQVRSVAVERVGARIGILPSAHLAELDEALRIHLAL